MNFTELSLHTTLQDALAKRQFITLTPIQEKSIPHSLLGKDVTGLAQTGTGKTLAFAIPILNAILEQDSKTSPFAICLAPTRELVLQTAEEFKKLLSETDIKVATIIGGTDYKSQEKDLDSKAQIIVATPGRLLDFIRNRSLNIQETKVVVLDEADRMLDMGFIHDIKVILNKTKDRNQTLLFSATLSHSILRIAENYQKDPIEVQINPEKIIAENIDQKLIHLGKEEKVPYIINYIKRVPMEGLGIIFTNYKSNIPYLSKTLERYGISSAGLSSDLDQKKRIRILRDYKLGKYKFLIATDVASRGIDVENIELVINYDLPQDTENYVHRIGRTARAGKKGTSLSICSEQDYPELERIEKYLGEPIATIAVRDEDLLLPEPTNLEIEVPSAPHFRKDFSKDGNRRPGQHGRDRGPHQRRDGKFEKRDGRPENRNRKFENRDPRPESPDGKPEREEGRSDFPKRKKPDFRKEGKPDFQKFPKNQDGKPKDFSGPRKNTYEKQQYRDRKSSQFEPDPTKKVQRRNLYNKEADGSKSRYSNKGKTSLWKRFLSWFGF